jgi:hypothetical protein
MGTRGWGYTRTYISKVLEQIYFLFDLENVDFTFTDYGLENLDREHITLVMV